MAIRFHIDIVSAESHIYSGQSDQVFVPTKQGELGIHARHAPLIALLKPGMLHILLDNKIKSTTFVSSGFIEVLPHIVTVLADTVIRSEEFDAAAAKAARYLEKEKTRKIKRSIDSQLSLEIALYRAMAEVKYEKSGQKKWPEDSTLNE